MWLEQDDIPTTAEIGDTKKSDETQRDDDPDRGSDEGRSDQPVEHHARKSGREK